ncbi:MAG: hypothetical protein ACYTDW_00540 [Planctomycetota bacterium]|jgi:UDP-GlcNAc3NAcA epimerase
MFIISIVYARPQFIKAAVSRAIAEHNKKSPEHPIVDKIVHTGQHYDDNMSKIFSDELQIPSAAMCCTEGRKGGYEGISAKKLSNLLPNVLM